MNYFTEGLAPNERALRTNKQMIKNYLGLNYYPETISMWVADMDYQLAPAIKDALNDVVAQQDLGYGLVNEAYRNSLINWYTRRYQVSVQPEWILPSNGTIQAIRNIIRSLTNEGDKVIIQTPVYSPFAGEIKRSKRKVLANKLIKNNLDYSIDLVDFEAKAKEASLFILCNPHNPTGDIWDEETLFKMLAIAKKYDVLVLADEVHSDLLRINTKFVSTLSYHDTSNLIVATAINKSFNLAGLQGTNLIISNPSLRNRLNAYTGMVQVSPFTISAQIAAYNESEDWLESLKVQLDTNFDYLVKFIQDKLPLVKFKIPQATYLAWLDFSAYNLNESALLNLLADEAKVLLEGGSMFNEEGYVRMNLALPLTTLSEALERIHQALIKSDDLYLKLDNLRLKIDKSRNIVELAANNGIGIPAPCLKGKRKGGCCKGCLIEVNGEKAYACNTQPIANLDIKFNRIDLNQERNNNLTNYRKQLQTNTTTSCCNTSSSCDSDTSCSTTTSNCGC